MIKLNLSSNNSKEKKALLQAAKILTKRFFLPGQTQDFGSQQVWKEYLFGVVIFQPERFNMRICNCCKSHVIVSKHLGNISFRCLMKLQQLRVRNL